MFETDSNEKIRRSLQHWQRTQTSETERAHSECKHLRLTQMKKNMSLTTMLSVSISLHSINKITPN